MMAPNSVHLRTDPQRSTTEALAKKVAQNGPSGAPTTSGNQHSLSAKRNWLTNSPPYGYGGRRADMMVLPVRIIMSPTSSSRLLAGRKARSATLRTTLPLKRAGAGELALPALDGREPYATR